MKRLLVITVLTLAAGLLLAPAALAAWPANCGQVSFSLTPSSGPAGTGVTVSGSGAMANFPFSLYWDSPTGTLLYSGTADGNGGFSATVTIPADASEGDHFIVFSGTDEYEASVNCPQEFVVTGSVQQDAYTQPVTTLPSTGAFLLPAAGLLAAGAGFIFTRRRG